MQSTQYHAKLAKTKTANRIAGGVRTEQPEVGWLVHKIERLRRIDGVVAVIVLSDDDSGVISQLPSATHRGVVGSGRGLPRKIDITGSPARGRRGAH